MGSVRGSVTHSSWIILMCILSVTSTTATTIHADVPQESCVSPLLFNSHLSDIPNFIRINLPRINPLWLHSSLARDCLRCAGDACVKCARLIVLGSRTCVDACPSGYREEWSALVDYMGRTSYMGLPGRTLAVIVGACSGAVICVGVLLGGVLYVRRRKLRLLREALEERPRRAARSASLCADRPSHTDVATPVDTPERREFLKHLSMLRCEAPVFLAMLNDTRRQTCIERFSTLPRLS
ncbi:Protein of unknown function [Gryllus bimaculatus]|nr:Protein of unknown function [Gryllus bimaculatus]